MMARLEITLLDVPEATVRRIAVATVVGRIDEATASIFEQRLNEISNDRVGLILDFSEVEYMNSFGIGILVHVQKKLLKAGGSIRICQLSPTMKKIFQITFLTKVFEIFDTRESAIAQLNGQTAASAPAPSGPSAGPSSAGVEPV